MLCFVSRLYAGHDVETSGAMGVNTAHQCQPLTAAEYTYTQTIEQRYLTL